MSALSPEQWQEISPYLDHALSLSEQERAEWLSDFRAQQSDIANLIEELLEEHDALSEEHFLEHQPPPPNEVSFQGETVGAYKLISQIGEGGMGNVWLAERVDGRFERRVAVKFLNFAVASQGAAERFKREGRILGQLAHPHIAELIDAGVTTKGEPYLVLEYVEGKQIDEYCDEHKLGVDARIGLFLDVLGAVAQAHANLVVHRDIKPSNVFVSNAGEVKLLDFGIAKLLADDTNSAAATTLTLEGGGAMTPVFAAPEQVVGGSITTATDVYGLGALLFLLLTGHPPAGPGPHSPANLVKSITEIDPPPASQAVVLRNDVTAAQKRSTTLEKLRGQLWGDLDTIIAKALKKNPAERYPSVTALADDLRRFLQHAPISARPDTLRYRAAKFVRRNRTAVALATLALAAVIAGLAGTLLQARSARKQRDFARRQLARAERINQLNQFLLSDVGAAGERLTVTELLDRAREIVERENYANDPANHVELLISIGTQYSRDPKALPLLQEAYQLSRGLADPSLRAKASCALGDLIANPKDNARAESLIKEGLRELPDDPDFAVDRVFCLLKADEVDAGTGSLAQPLADDRAAEKALNSSGLRSSYLQLSVLRAIGVDSIESDLAQAIAADQQAIALEKELGYGNTATAADTFLTLGLALMKAGRPYEAEQAYRQANQIRPLNLWAYSMQAYAEPLRELSRLDEAADYAKRAQSKILTEGKNDVVEIFCLAELVRIYRDQHDFAHAEATFVQLEKLTRSAMPPGDSFFYIISSERSLLSQAEGNLTAALASADQTLSGYEAWIPSHGGSAPWLPLFLYRRAGIEVACGQPDKAIQDAHRALTLLRSLLGKDTFSSHTGRATVALGRALQALGKTDEARAAFHAAAQNFDSALGPEHPESREAHKLAGV